MNILKTVLIFIITITLPMLGIVLATDGAIRIVLLSALVFSFIILFWFSDRLILLSLGAREIIDADNQALFQSLKGQSYRYHEKAPKVYLYSGHRVKCFLVEKFGSWSIVLDRSLIKSLDKEQIEALVTYIIEYKKRGYGKIQTIGMGILAITLKFTYWFWSLFAISPSSKIPKVGIFVSLILIKPLIEFVIKLSKVNKKIEGTFPLKSIYMQVDLSVTERTFTEFMIYHLDKESSLSDLVVEFLEEYPMLENCSFEESV